MHKGHDTLGIATDGLTMMRSQTRIDGDEALCESLHGTVSGKLLRVQIRSAKDHRYSYAIVETMLMTGWTPVWKMEGDLVRTRFSDKELLTADIMFSEDLSLLLQIGMEIVTLSRAGGRF